MKILYKLTSRSRPLRLFRVINNIQSLSTTEDYLIWCTLDSDDVSCADIAHQLDKIEKVKYHYGRSKSKVDAINRDMDLVPEWDILVNVSDDQLFLAKGFDEIIINAVTSAREDCFIHFPEENAKHYLATMSIMDKRYYSRDNYIYHPSYFSLWCDNEALEVAKRRGRHFIQSTLIFEHLHPVYKKAPWDEQYYRTEAYYQQDQKNYKLRLANDFK